MTNPQQLPPTTATVLEKNGTIPFSNGSIFKGKRVHINNGYTNKCKIPLEVVVTIQFALAGPLRICNSCRCTTIDSYCSNHCSIVLHPFLMSNSHPLNSLFMPFKLVAHSLLPVVQGIVPLLFPMVLEAALSNWSIHTLGTPKCPSIISKSARKLLQPVPNTMKAKATG